MRKQEVISVHKALSEAISSMRTCRYVDRREIVVNIIK